jgi:quercetin dioxygenase-like cupin family protein
MPGGGGTMEAKSYFLKAEETCLEGPLNIFGDNLRVKCGGKSTNMTVMLSSVGPKEGPPLHRHTREDETFYILEGEFLFECDGKQTRGSTGTFVFLSRGTAHAFQNVGGTTGKMLIITQPAGIEDFFSEIDKATRGMKGVDMSILLPIFAKYEIEFLGPPIAARGK